MNVFLFKFIQIIDHHRHHLDILCVQIVEVVVEPGGVGEERWQAWEMF